MNKNIKKSTKMMNSKGFTLIELLAVIVILAVLMITAIPAVTSAIAKSRRDTYATNSKKIIDAVRTSIINEEFVEGGVTCQLPGPGEYVTVDLMQSVTTNGTNKATIIETLLERGGTNSSFNQKYSFGKIFVVNEGNVTFDKYVYYIYLIDAGKNGVNNITAENQLSRNKVVIGSATAPSGIPATATKTAHACTYTG